MLYDYFAKNVDLSVFALDALASRQLPNDSIFLLPFSSLHFFSTSINLCLIHQILQSLIPRGCSARYRVRNIGYAAFNFREDPQPETEERCACIGRAGGSRREGEERRKERAKRVEADLFLARRRQWPRHVTRRH